MSADDDRILVEKYGYKMPQTERVQAVRVTAQGLPPVLVEADAGRYIPGVEGTGTAHIEQYEHAAKVLIEHMRKPAPTEPVCVNDYGCGFGYGAAVLLRSMKAAGFGAGRMLAVAMYDPVTAPGGTRSIPTAAVCVEVIEHAPRGDVLVDLSWAMAPGALLYLTTPDRDRRSLGDKNPHHVHEYTEAELREDLAECGFEVVAGPYRYSNSDVCMGFLARKVG